MGSIGLWLDDGREEAADILASAGLVPADAAVGAALPEDCLGLVADQAILAAQAGVVAQAKARRGAALFPVLAVLPAAAEDAAVAEALSLADEVILRPLRPSELTRRLARLLAARDACLALGGLAACGARAQAALVAGIAQELTTPVQYVAGNLDFLGTALTRLLELLDTVSACALDSGDGVALAEELTRLLGDEELVFLLQEAPAAIRESTEGLDRVTECIEALNRFAGSRGERPEPVDLPQAVSDALAVTRHAWRHAAEVRLDIDAGLPPVLFGPAALGQVLTLVVAAAVAAVEARARAHGGQGHIAIRAGRLGPVVELVVADDGFALPGDDGQERVAPGGLGSPGGACAGHGLALAGVLVARYKARLEVLTAPGEGNQVVITLPVAEQPVLGR